MTKLKYCYSHLKSFVVFMFWIVLFMFLNHFSTHTLHIHFSHPTSFFPSLTHSLNSFTSYTVSYITNLDNSVHPFHFPYSSFSTLTTSLHLECCATSFILLFQQRNAHRHTSFFNSSHICDSLRSTSIRLSDDCSLHSSIPHHTAAQPALWTKSYHCSQIPFVFLNLLIGVCAEMPHSQWIAVCIDSIKKMICSSPDGLWTCLITFSSRFSTSNRSFGHLRWAKNARNLHIHQPHSLESNYSSCISHTRIRKILWWERCWIWVWWMWRKKWAWWRKKGRRSDSENGRLRWIDDVCWKMFKVSHLREIGRTNE